MIPARYPLGITGKKKKKNRNFWSRSLHLVKPLITIAFTRIRAYAKGGAGPIPVKPIHY
jgi:hypothetical protein